MRFIVRLFEGKRQNFFREVVKPEMMKSIEEHSGRNVNSGLLNLIRERIRIDEIDFTEGMRLNAQINTPAKAHQLHLGCKGIIHIRKHVSREMVNLCQRRPGSGHVERLSVETSIEIRRVQINRQGNSNHQKRVQRDVCVGIGIRVLKTSSTATRANRPAPPRILPALFSELR
jgi:hypothetical protein